MGGMLVVMVFLWAWCGSFSNADMVPAPAPLMDCSSEISLLVPCLGYVQGTDKTPNSDCCSGLTSVVDNSPVCLCQLIDSRAGADSGINTTHALELPSKCNLTNLSADECSALLPGAPTSALSPTPAPDHFPTGAPSPSEFFGPVPAPKAGGSISGGVFGSPSSTPPAASNSASMLAPLLWISPSLMTLFTFL